MKLLRVNLESAEFILKVEDTVVKAIEVVDLGVTEAFFVYVGETLIKDFVGVQTFETMIEVHVEVFFEAILILLQSNLSPLLLVLHVVQIFPEIEDQLRGDQS